MIEVLALKGHLGWFHKTYFPTAGGWGEPLHCPALGRRPAAGAAARVCVRLCVAEPLCFASITPPLFPPRVSVAGISQVERRWLQAGARRADKAAAGRDRGPRGDRRRRGGCGARALPACGCVLSVIDSSASGWLFSPCFNLHLGPLPAAPRASSIQEAGRADWRWPREALSSF